MKVFWRIIYALVAVILFLFVHIYSKRIITTMYFENKGAEALKENGEHKYLFFYGATGYHLHEPTYKFYDNNIRLEFFEIAILKINNKDEKQVEEFFYIILEHDETPIFSDGVKTYSLVFNTADLDDNGHNISKSFNIFRFWNLDISLAVNENGEALIAKEEFLSHKIISLELDREVENQKTTLMKKDIAITNSDFVISEALLNNYQDEEKLKNDYGIYPKNIHVASGYEYIYVIYFSIYIVILGVATYFIFFFKKRSKRKKHSKKEIRINI